MSESRLYCATPKCGAYLDQYSHNDFTRCEECHALICDDCRQRRDGYWLCPRCAALTRAKIIAIGQQLEPLVQPVSKPHPAVIDPITEILGAFQAAALVGARRAG